MDDIVNLNPKCPDGHEMIRDYPNKRIEWICPICGYMKPYVKSEGGKE